MLPSVEKVCGWCHVDLPVFDQEAWREHFWNHHHYKGYVVEPKHGARTSAAAGRGGPDAS